MKQLLCDMWLWPCRTLDSREKGNKQTCDGPSAEAFSTHTGGSPGRQSLKVGRSRAGARHTEGSNANKEL